MALHCGSSIVEAGVLSWRYQNQTEMKPVQLKSTMSSRKASQLTENSAVRQASFSSDISRQKYTLNKKPGLGEITHRALQRLGRQSNIKLSSTMTRGIARVIR